MGSFFSGKKIVILITAAALIIVMGILTVLSGGRASPVSNIVGVVTAPITRGIGGITGWFSSIYAYIYEFDSLQEENRQLRLRIAEMEERERISADSIEENERLRKLLELRQQRRDFIFESAAILSWSPSNWTSSFTIGKGSVHGVVPGNCVITEEGFFVGYVTEVGINWSAVTTLIDTDTEIGASISRTGEVCMVEGDFSLMSAGMTKLTFLPQNTGLLNGDLVLTSGTGGVFPKDLVIGMVTEVRTEDTGMNRYAIVKPTVDFGELTQIFVIKAFELEE